MDGSITTNKGIALIGKLLAQKGALQITRVAVGDGTPPASPATLNALVHELKNATIESVDNPKNGEAKIVVTVSSIGVTQGFFVKEIGVFAKDTDGKEILYAYAGFSDNPQWIRPEGTAITNVATYDINTIIDRVQDFGMRFMDVESSMNDTLKKMTKLKITTADNGPSIITAAKKLLMAGAKENKKKKTLDEMDESMFIESDTEATEEKTQPNNNYNP